VGIEGMLPKRASIGPVVAALLLSACGSSGTGSSSATSPSPSAAASATSRVLIVVSDHDPGDPRSATLRLLRPDGTVVQTLTVKAGAELLEAAGSRIFVRSGTALKAIHQDGSVEELGDLGGSGRFAASPDGKRWMWATRDANQGQVHMAGDGMSPRVVAQSSTEPRAIEPYTWTPVGAFLMDAPVGIGGYILFDPAAGPVKKLDLTSFSTSPVAHTDTCSFSEMRRDGTIACLGGSGQNVRSLILFAPAGKQQTIDLAMPRFAQSGDAYFSPDGKQVTVAGATGAGADGHPEQYGTDVVTVRDGSIRRLAIDGVRLPSFLRWQSWLADGSLVVWRPEGAAGGPAGVFIVGPDGNSTQISQGGFPIGMLAG
jgi:hypothetical protein